ncbi:sensor histidine kinase [Streptomyces aureocirculatus]|uniref:sensor histidine kinase n=1 Tax=Streptomyces aureocirculatus TaxID=67275 RepID=UPI00099CE890|nr:histidine kinase [Streptomyces aureocirculatus]
MSARPQDPPRRRPAGPGLLDRYARLLDRYPERRTAARLLLAAVLVLLVTVEGLTLGGRSTGPRAAVWTAGILCCLCAVPWARPPLALRAWTAAGVSWAATLYVFLSTRPGTVWGMGEAIALLVLLTGVLLRLPARPAAVLGPLLALACVAAPVRDASPGRFTLLFSALAAVVSAFSLLLRAQQAQRVRDVQAVRAAERLELARELHDLVAHHVTGIVVQARAASFTAIGADAAATTFTRIADAGDEALGAMRRLVRVLREGAAPTVPLAGLAALRDLAETHTATGPPVTVTVEPGLQERLPADLAATAHHIVREALTNVRRHAAGARSVHVGVRLVEGGLEVRVTDDGGHRAAPTAAPAPRGTDRGGFGLTGLEERATALGGTLTAGPTADGGWEVRAVLPYGQGAAG